MRRHFAAIVLLCVSSQAILGQVAQPLGVTVQHAVPRRSSDVSVVHHPMPSMSDGERGSIWPWLGIGVLGGAAIGGAVAVAQVAKTDDPFMPGLAVGVAVAAGGVVGGAVGALLYAITHMAGAPER